MADILNNEGLELDNYNTLLSNIQNNLNQIYAPNDSINFGSETPDGQFTNILAQIGSDVRQLAMEIYNSFNPDNCSGSVQDERYALNFITRKGGTYTIQNIDITCNQTISLQGLDGNYDNPEAGAYTVSDDAGNLWYLIDSVTITAGTTSLPFRSQEMGYSQVTIGTITTQVTKVLGVTSVINSVAPTTIGEVQESDAEFRVRRNSSFKIKGQTNYDAMKGQLLALDGVTDCNIFVNNDNSTNTDVTGDVDNGVPAFNIWVIIEGGSSNQDIASIIYENSAGLPTFGYENEDEGITPVEISTISNSNQPFLVKFNRVNPVPLYIRFDIKIATTGFNLNEDNIKSYIAENAIFKLNQPAETSYITEIASQALLQYNSNIYALNVEVSNDGNTWTDYIPSNSWQDKFVVSESNITITQV